MSSRWLATRIAGRSLVIASVVAIAGCLCASCSKEPPQPQPKTSTPVAVQSPNDFYQEAVELQKVGDPASLKQAIELYTKAADAGHASAQYRLGMCYRDGTGIEANKELATKYFKMGADNGNAGASQALAALTAPPPPPVVTGKPIIPPQPVRQKPVQRPTTKQAVPLYYAARADNNGGAYATSLVDLEYLVCAMPDAKEWQPGPCLGKVYQEPTEGTIPVYQFRLKSEYLLASDPADVAALRQLAAKNAQNDSESVAFYAYPAGGPSGQSVPIRQYSSEKTRTHFYVLDSDEDLSKIRAGIRQDKVVFNALGVSEAEEDSVREDVAWLLSTIRERFVQTIIKGVAGQWQRTDKFGNPASTIAISSTGKCAVVEQPATKLDIQVGDELLLLVQGNGTYDAFPLADLNSERLEGMSLTPESKITYTRLPAEAPKVPDNPPAKETPANKPTTKNATPATPAQRIVASLAGKWQRIDPTSKNAMTIEVKPTGDCSIVEQPSIQVSLQFGKNQIMVMQSTGLCDKFGNDGVTGKNMDGVQFIYTNVTYSRIGPGETTSEPSTPITPLERPAQVTSEVSLRRIADARKYMQSKVELLAYDYRYPMASFNAALMTQWLKFKSTTPQQGVTVKPRKVLDQEAHDQIEKSCPEIPLTEFESRAKAQLPPLWKVGDTVEFVYCEREPMRIPMKGRLESVSGDTAKISSFTTSTNPIVHPGSVDDAGRAGLFESERPKVIAKVMNAMRKKYLYDRSAAKTSTEVTRIWRTQGYNEVLDEWLGAEEVRRTVAACVPEAREIRALLNAGYVKYYGGWITRQQYELERARDQEYDQRQREFAESSNASDGGRRGTPTWADGPARIYTNADGTSYRLDKNGNRQYDAQATADALFHQDMRRLP